MKKEKLHFYLLRLRNSSLPELFCRIKQFYLLQKLKRQISENKDPVTVPKINFKNLKDLRLPSFHGGIGKNDIQKILAGKFIDLNTDITAIRKFEEDHRQLFFSEIEFSQVSPDIRAIWEPARLQHLVILLRYILQVGETSDVKVLQKVVSDSVIGWIRKNPFLFGPHYISAMECGLRIPVFFYCIKMLDNLSDSERHRIIDAVYRHGWWIYRHLSLYSSLGNHTVAECVGLIFAGAMFRHTKEGHDWVTTGRNLLKQELDHQILEDGGPAEHSFNYHRFVLDLYWLAIDFLEKNDLFDCSEFKERLKQGERFNAAFRDVCDKLPPIGDSDDGHAIAPFLHPQRIMPQKKVEKIQTFSTSGYTGINLNTTAITFQHGPLGMAPLYNHGHADALSITLSVDGKEILVDPGTYRYNGEPEFRRYFKGTRAHNTVTVDGLDQAVQETGFIWSKPYTARLLKSVETGGGHFLRASHDGYNRIKVRHVRSVFVDDHADAFIKDTFVGRGTHNFELNYHIHPDAEITSENNGWWKINRQGAVIFIKLSGEHNPIIVKGQKNPLFGWYSPAYGIKHESYVLNCRMRGNPKEVSFTTAICTSSPKEMKTLS